jgi:hypothetical protein
MPVLDHIFYYFNGILQLLSDWRRTARAPLITLSQDKCYLLILIVHDSLLEELNVSETLLAQPTRTLVSLDNIISFLIYVDLFVKCHMQALAVEDLLLFRGELLLDLSVNRRMITRAIGNG